MAYVPPHRRGGPRAPAPRAPVPRAPGEARAERHGNSRAMGLRDTPAPPRHAPRGFPPPPREEEPRAGEENILVRQITESNTFPKFLPPISDTNRETSSRILDSLPLLAVAIWKASKHSEYDVTFICQTSVREIYLCVNVHVGLPSRRPEDAIKVGSAYLSYGDEIPERFIKDLQELGKSYYESYRVQEYATREGNVLHDVRIPEKWLRIIHGIQKTHEENTVNAAAGKFKIMISSGRSSPFLDRPKRRIGFEFIRVFKSLSAPPPPGFAPPQA